MAAYPLFARWTETATNGSGLKQGDSTTLTWSLPADGITTENSGSLENGGAPNNLLAFLDTNWGTGPGGSDLTLRPWFKYFDESLNRIGSIAGLSLQHKGTERPCTDFVGYGWNDRAAVRERRWPW